MATAERPKSSGPAPKRKQPKQGRSHAFRYGSLLTLMLLLATAYFAPWLVAHTPVGPWLVRAAAPVDGTITFGSASLDWMSSVVVNDVEIRDAEGESVATIATIRTEKSLLALLLDTSDLGLLKIEQPVIHVVARETRSNVEDLLADILAADESKAGPVGMHLQITDGTVLIDDLVAKRQFKVEALTVDFTISGHDRAMALATSGQVQNDKQPGEFKIELQTSPSSAEETALANGKINCQTSRLPLELLEPVLRRGMSEGTIAGQWSTQLAGAWGDQAERGAASVVGKSTIQGLSITAAALAGDRIDIDHIEIPCHLVQNEQDQRVEIQQLALQCSLANLNMTGSLKLSDLSAEHRWMALARETYQVEGQLDLAKLAAMLPQTLRIQEATEITSGELTLAITSQGGQQHGNWSGQIHASRLAARSEGQAIAWDKPLAIEFAAHDTEQGLIVDRVLCESQSLRIDAAGTADQLAATGEFDLTQLVQQLRQFSSLGGVQLAGRGQAKLNWQRDAQNQMTLAANMAVQGFQFAPAPDRVWNEESVTAQLNMNGRFEGSTLHRVDSAQLVVQAGSERLQAQLSQPLDDPAHAPWPVVCDWQGKLAHWPARLDSCFGLAGWNMAGTAKLQATLNCTRQQIEIAKLQAECTPFQIWGHDWYINEPSFSGVMSGRMKLDAAGIEVDQAKLIAGTTSATINKLTAHSQRDGWAIDGGTAQVLADMATLYRWHHDPRQPIGWQVAGRLTADAELKYQDGTTLATATGAIDQLQVIELVRPTAPGVPATPPATWREKRVALAARGTYQANGSQLQLEKLQLTSDAMELTTAGTLSTAATGGPIHLKGTLAYDWTQLAPLWRQVLGDNIQIVGRQSRAFAVDGQLSGGWTNPDAWRQVTGDAAIGWSAASVQGLRVGQGEVAAKLADGQIQLQAANIPISEGRLNFSPLIRLTPAPALVMLPQGPMLTDLHLTPDLCSRGLKFLAPVLAESSVADGRFSVTLDGGRTPLADLGAGDISGHLALQGHVKAGPVLQEFIVLLNEITTVLKRGTLNSLNDKTASLMSIDSSNIEFRMVNRRVYHRNLTLTVGTTPITTHGSVGLDETLAIVAEVPVQAKLLGIDFSLGTLEGQTIMIPINGTLSQPKLERGVIQQLAAKMLENTTKGVLIDGVNKQLDRFLPLQR